MHTCDCILCSSNCSESAVIVSCFDLFLLGLYFSSFTCFPESLQLLLGWWGIHYYFSLIKVLSMEACRQICNGGVLYHEVEGVPSSNWTLLWWLLLLLGGPIRMVGCSLLLFSYQGLVYGSFPADSQWGMFGTMRRGFLPSFELTLLWWLLLLLRGPSEYFFAGIFQNCWQKGKNWVLLCKFCPTAVAC